MRAFQQHVSNGKANK